MDRQKKAKLSVQVGIHRAELLCIITIGEGVFQLFGSSNREEVERARNILKC